MTFEQYINNPMGVKNAVISNREIIKASYIAKLDKLMVRENGKVNYIMYKGKVNYYIYMKIPSETIEDFYYDVVIEFSPKDHAIIPQATLANYEVRFFSNDPAFVFTFAHAFIKNDMFFTDMKEKMSREAINKVAVEKNPKNTIGYVKTLYFAYILCKQHNLLSKVKFSTADSYDKKALLSMITNADDKIASRTDAGRKFGIKKNRTKDIAPPPKRAVKPIGDNIKLTKMVPITSTKSKGASKPPSAYAPKITKTIKKIGR